ncbi:MAG: hypothetical protein LBK73_00665 [Treponema sp.]|jgi:hypothetical protein|nr:hypothetical protein [Treponema sp.]
MIAERKLDVRDTVNALYRISEDPEVRAQMECREKARREARSRVEIARNMKSLAYPRKWRDGIHFLSSI